MEWCIRKFQSSSIISFNVISTAHNLLLISTLTYTYTYTYKVETKSSWFGIKDTEKPVEHSPLTLNSRTNSTDPQEKRINRKRAEDDTRANTNLRILKEVPDLYVHCVNYED